MKTSMNASVRKRNGLGDPPKQHDHNHDHNAHEAKSSVIRKAKGKGIISAKETIKFFHQEVKSQEEKLKTSWIGRGELQLTNEMKDVLQITQQNYASMNSVLKIRYFSN